MDKTPHFYGFGCLGWCLTSQTKKFSHEGTEPTLPGYYQYFRGVKCLAQGHNTAEVGFESLDLSLRSPTHKHPAYALPILWFSYRFLKIFSPLPVDNLKYNNTYPRTSRGNEVYIHDRPFVPYLIQNSNLTKSMQDLMVKY